MDTPFGPPRIMSRRAATGRCTGPKWCKMVKMTWSKQHYSEPDFGLRETNLDGGNSALVIGF